MNTHTKPHRPAAAVRAIAPLVAAALASHALAQDLGVKAAPQSDDICIYNAAIHPISGPDIENGFISFSNGVIREVAAGPVHVPASFVKTAGTFIDAKGKHVYPGMIAPVSQLGLTEIQAVRPTNDLGEIGDVTPEVLASTAVNPDSTLLPVTRSNGVLSAGVFPTGGLVPGRASVIRMDGWTNDQLAYAMPNTTPGSSAAGLILNWPAMRTFNAWWMTRSEEEQRKDIAKNLDRIASVFDTARAYADTRAADPASPTDLRWEAMRPLFAESTSAKLPLFVFAGDYDQIVAAVSFAKERGLTMILVGGRDAPLAAELLKQNDVPVIITGTHAMPKRADSPYDDAFTLPARLHAAGVRFCIASADDSAHERNLPYNAAMAAAHGLAMDAALRSVTLSAAEIVGLGAELGSLDVGKRATIIVTDGNPLEITTRVERAYIDGRQIDLSNKQTVLAEKYRERYRQNGQLRPTGAPPASTPAAAPPTPTPGTPGYR